MKNKGLTYGLIVVVGVIWYQVFIRVKSNITGEDVPSAALTEAPAGKRLSKREAFHLRADYRDPFSGSLSEAVVSPPVANNAPPSYSAPREPKPRPLPPQWPVIKYYGLVRKTTSTLPRTLLSIDGTFYQLKQGDAVLDNITVKRTYRDSVVIYYKKQNRTFYKLD